MSETITGPGVDPTSPLQIAEGAVRIDDEPVTDPGYLVLVVPGTERKLSLGRKRHAILRGA